MSSTTAKQEPVASESQSTGGCFNTVSEPLARIRDGIDRVGQIIESNLPMDVITAVCRPLLRKRDIAAAIAEGQEESRSLSKCLNAFDLIGIGVGCIIGAGIFVITGVAANTKAGPSLMLSFVFSGIVCVFSALCYAEFAARVPIAGSAYTYAYTTVGEFIAWIIGWNLVLEYTIGAATVARGWSGYLVDLLGGFGITYPAFLYSIPIENPYVGVELDITAFCAVAIITIVLALGVKESTRFNMIVVILTLVIIVFIICAGAYLGTIENWKPFFPYKLEGMFRGSAAIFFAYVGFDAVATAAEEAKNPKRDLPIGILVSLGVSTVLYVLVTGVLTMMIPYYAIDLDSPLAAAFGSYGWGWAQILVAFGAFAALTTSILGNLLSQPRIFFSMGRDGLLPAWFSQVHPKFKTPLNSTLVTGGASALLAFFLDIETLSEMVSIGTLMACTIVCCAVLTIRYSSPERPYQSTALVSIFTALVIIPVVCYLVKLPYYVIIGSTIPALIAATLFFFLETADRPASFATPLVPLVPLLGIACNVFMMSNLGFATWIRLVVWLALGLLLYFLYGIRNSKIVSTVNPAAEVELNEIPASEEQSAEPAEINKESVEV